MASPAKPVKKAAAAFDVRYEYNAPQVKAVQACTDAGCLHTLTVPNIPAAQFYDFSKLDAEHPETLSDHGEDDQFFLDPQLTCGAPPPPFFPLQPSCTHYTTALKPVDESKCRPE